MRSCLIQIAIALLVVLVLMWVALPLGAGWLATNALNASGFTGTDTKVEVSANPPPILLTGHADRIHLSSHDVGIQELHAGSIDITLTDVSLLNRTFSEVDGTLEDVLIPAPNGEPVVIDSASVQGDSTSALATLSVSEAEASQLIESQIKSQTGATADVTMADPNRVTITVNGQSQPCTLRVADGTLQMVPDGGALPTVVLIRSGDGNPFTLTSSRIEQGHVILMGTIDVQSLLGI